MSGSSAGDKDLVAQEEVVAGHGGEDVDLDIFAGLAGGGTSRAWEK